MPGGSHLNFGSFQQSEIKNLWKLKINDNKSVAINEYGTNLFKLQHDPLVVTEAKMAMWQGQLPEVNKNLKKSELLQEGPGTVNMEMEVQVVQEQEEKGEAVCPSPETGTQEAPLAEWSSQEDSLVQTKQGGEFTMPDSAHNDITEKEQPKAEEEKRTSSPLVEWEQAKQANRQSSRIKQQGMRNLKVAEKAEIAAMKKNMEERKIRQNGVGKNLGFSQSNPCILTCAGRKWRIKTK
ncbi:unnamed protein product [Urochloa decumbens]|uniref:Uncharacterized protein n=1 Tax=Urochloa decumbens TaxID=240449 RepID=A0ABC9EZE2_9POAL